jgi:hypothetical protein
MTAHHLYHKEGVVLTLFVTIKIMYPPISAFDLPSSASSTTLGPPTEHYIILDDK